MLVMDNLDDKIDTLVRDKLISLIQENAIRIKKITIKFTKSNKKHTMDHWQTFYDSYDKIYRNMPRELLRVEREVRKKFVSPLTEDRITRIKTMINLEGDLLFEKLAVECQPAFEKLGQGKEYEQRVEQTRKKLSENLDQQIQKSIEALNEDTGQGQKFSVQDLIEIYGIKESMLHELNIISPLRNINSQLSKVNGDSRLADILNSVQDGFRFLFQDIQKIRSSDVTSKDARKKLKMEVARDTLTVREIVLNSQPFMEQLALPKDKRNREIIKKSWLKFFEVLEGQGERWKKVIPHFKPLYNFMLDEES